VQPSVGFYNVFNFANFDTLNGLLTGLLGRSMELLPWDTTLLGWVSEPAFMPLARLGRLNSHSSSASEPNRTLDGSRHELREFVLRVKGRRKEMNEEDEE
jgi:hypothetical protein